MITLTKGLIIVVIILLVIYDFIAFLTGGTEATISVVIIRWSREYPAIPFAVGFLMGHLFWQLELKKDGD